MTDNNPVDNGISWEDLDVWKKRKDELLGAIKDLKRYLRSNSTVPRALALRQLLDCLAAFLGAQFGYFEEAFRDPAKHSSEFPPDHVMRVIMDQASFDLDVIRRVINDRKLCSEHERNTLKLADCLAYQAIKPVQALFNKDGLDDQFFDDQEISSALFGKDVQVFTYYQKSPSIRLIPYASVALIGIPYTSAENRRDLLAIPHEVGHYVFWHAIKIKKPPFQFHPNEKKFVEDLYRNVNNNTTDINKKIRKFAIAYYWQEEIFADVYGALIAGPIIALDFQDLQLENNRERFCDDDGEHPSPVLRPYIYINSLRENGDEDALWAHSLVKRWQSKIKDRGVIEQFKSKKGFRKFLYRLFLGSEDRTPDGLTKDTVAHSQSILYDSSQTPTLDQVKKKMRDFLDGIIKEVDQPTSPNDTNKKFPTEDLITTHGNMNDDIPVDRIIDWVIKLLSSLEFADGNHWSVIRDRIHATLNADPIITQNWGIVYQEFDTVVNEMDISLRDSAENGIEVECLKIKNVDCISHDCLVSLWEYWWPHTQPNWRPIFKAGGWAVKGPNEVWPDPKYR